MARGGKREGAGRKKGVPNKSTAEMKELARAYAPEALEALADIMRCSESEAAKVAAIKEILDRAYGKPTQSVEVGKPGEFAELEDMSDADLTDIARGSGSGIAAPKNGAAGSSQLH